MELARAVQLIEHPFLNSKNTVSYWADLGAGAGTFTLALAELLPNGSLIYAVDRDRNALAKIPVKHKEVNIQKEVQNFQEFHIASKLDGLLMANSLHYIQDKRSFLKHLQAYLKLDHQLILIEYDTRHGNPWVPYPIPFSDLESLFQELPYGKIEKIGSTHSIYSNGNIYAALVQSIPVR